MSAARAPRRSARDAAAATGIVMAASPKLILQDVYVSEVEVLVIDVGVVERAGTVGRS